MTCAQHLGHPQVSLPQSQASLVLSRQSPRAQAFALAQAFAKGSLCLSPQGQEQEQERATFTLTWSDAQSQGPQQRSRAQPQEQPQDHQEAGARSSSGCEEISSDGRAGEEARSCCASSREADDMEEGEERSIHHVLFVYLEMWADAEQARHLGESPARWPSTSRHCWRCEGHFASATQVRLIEVAKHFYVPQGHVNPSTTLQGPFNMRDASL